MPLCTLCSWPHSASSGICRKPGYVKKRRRRMRRRRRRRRRLLIRTGRPRSSGSRAKRITEEPAELAGRAGCSYSPRLKLC